MAWYAERSASVGDRSEPAAVGSQITFEDFYVEEFAAVVGLAFALSGSRSGAEDLPDDGELGPIYQVPAPTDPGNANLTRGLRPENMLAEIRGSSRGGLQTGDPPGVSKPAGRR